LLGALPPEQAEPVVAWLSSDPSAGDVLQALAAGDLLTDALADTGSDEPAAAPSVERIIQSVCITLGTTSFRAPSGTSTPLHDRDTVPPAAERSAMALPTRLGVYRVVRELGRGGMGVVLEAEDERLRRRVALKVMSPHRAENPETKTRFFREARAAGAIDHDNVVPIHHVDEDGGVPFIVMPLLQGESLQARLKREPQLPVTDVIRLGREVASGLAAAHARGLVHRDIKPANIWLDAATGRARILDFGLARDGGATDGLTEPGAVLGTPAYMAPEQVDGLPADQRADLFSLGTTLYQCATGQPAFQGPTLTALLKAIGAHQPAPPHRLDPAIPRPLSELILRLIAKSPSARPQSAQAVADELATISPFPGTPGKRAGRDGRLRRRLLVGAAAAVLVVAIGAWALIHHPGPAVVQSPAATQPGPAAATEPSRTTLMRYQGWVDLRVERNTVDGHANVLKLQEPGARPLRKSDRFRIEGRVDPPAYLYAVWVDPGHDVTLVYPWDATVDDSRRPAKEAPTAMVSLPSTAGNTYTIPDAEAGVVTIVLFARPTPLDVSDDTVRGWFEGLPELPLPRGGEDGAVWFKDYVELRDADFSRTFALVESEDPFARWQGQLQKRLGKHAAFEASVSFARTGRK
jgi:hypothetical protein